MKAEPKILDTGMTLPTPEELERAMRAGNRERARTAAVLWRAMTGAISQVPERLARRLQSTRFTSGGLAASVTNPAATR